MLTGQTDLYAEFGFNKQQLKVIDQYTSTFEGLIVQVVGAALKQMVPVTLSYGVGAPLSLQDDFLTNRDQIVQSSVRGQTLYGVITSTGNGYHSGDHDIPVLAVRAVGSNQLIAVVFTYACHAVILDGQDYSPDWPGAAEADLESAGTTALFLQGAAGDANPDVGVSGQISDVNAKGLAIANAVRAVLNGSLLQVSGPIVSSYQEIALPLDLNQKDGQGVVIDSSRLLSIYQSLTTSTNPYVARHAAERVAEIQNGTLPTTEPYPIQAWSVGKAPSSFILLALGGEPVSGYSLFLKSQFANQLGNRLWVAGYSNEVPSYIPTQQIHDTPATRDCQSCASFGNYEAGWGYYHFVFVNGGVDVTAAIADGSQLFYGWPSRFKMGPGGTEDLVINTSSQMISGLLGN